jgi:hypothetical protein
MLILENTDIWSLVEKGAIGIPTNGFVSRNGAGVMGAGLAYDAKDRYPGIVFDLGTHIRREGNVVGWLRKEPHQIIAIPVKPSFHKIENQNQKKKILPKVRSIYGIGETVPGFYCMADIKLIERSLNQLVDFIEKNSLKTVFIPLLGCGNGGLSPTRDLFPLLERMDLPDSIVLVVQTKDLAPEVEEGIL